MIRVIAICAFAGLLLSLGSVAIRQAAAQRFPYEAPRAPEFDDKGNPVDSMSARKPQRNSQASKGRPVAPRTQWSSPTPKRSHAARKYRRSPVPTSTPNVPVQQPQGPPDCSQFPGLIATARAPNQMRWYARQYLTCLLKRGWRMPQAKQEVIRIIESSRRASR